LARVLPFAAFLALTLLQGRLGAASLFWLYGLKTLLGAYLVWLVWPLVAEMRWKFGWDAVLTGVVVFGLWVALGRGWGTQQGLAALFGLSAATPAPAPSWNPFAAFGDAPELAWCFVALRLIGSSLVVPPIEEAFYRSFVYRWFIDAGFDRVPLACFAWRPFLFTSLVFGFAHQEWLAGILCGAAYQTPRRGDDGARDHELPARRVGGDYAGVAVLVGRADISSVSRIVRNRSPA